MCVIMNALFVAALTFLAPSFHPVCSTPCPVAEVTIPEINSPVIEGDRIYIDDVGHPDILDDRWASMAEQTNLWPTVKTSKTSFHEWKLQPKDKNDFLQKLARSKYHSLFFLLES